MQFKEIKYSELNVKTIYEINNITVGFSEWWSVFDSRFYKLNRFYRSQPQYSYPLPPYPFPLTVKVPIITDKEMKDLGL